MANNFPHLSLVSPLPGNQTLQRKRASRWPKPGSLIRAETVPLKERGAEMAHCLGKPSDWQPRAPGRPDVTTSEQQAIQAAAAPPLSPWPGRLYAAPAQQDLNVGGSVLRTLLYVHPNIPGASPAAFPTKSAWAGLLSCFSLALDPDI